MLKISEEQLINLLRSAAMAGLVWQAGCFTQPKEVDWLLEGKTIDNLIGNLDKMECERIANQISHLFIHENKIIKL